MKTLNSSLSVVVLAMLAFSAQAAQNMVQNGNFESTTNGGGQLGDNTEATGWNANGGYTFLFTSGSADTTGVTGQYGNLQLWGPNNGSANGLPASSPDGGNFIAADGDYNTQPLTQAIAGLVAGEQYTVTFDYGFAQQEGYTGATEQYWAVSLGGSAAAATPIYNLASKGFSGWMTETVTLTAGSSNDLLSFIAYGNLPVPPFALLDGVSLVDPPTIPEPDILALWAVGMLSMLLGRRKTV